MPNSYFLLNKGEGGELTNEEPCQDCSIKYMGQLSEKGVKRRLLGCGLGRRGRVGGWKMTKRWKGWKGWKGCGRGVEGVGVRKKKKTNKIR